MWDLLYKDEKRNNISMGTRVVNNHSPADWWKLPRPRARYMERQEELIK